MKDKICILFLNENPLPPVFTQGSIAGKELRLRTAQPFIDEIHVIARRGNTVADPTNIKIGPLEKKVIIHLLPIWPYYLAGIPLFFWGLYYCWKLKPKTIEAESPIISGPAAVIIAKIFNIPSIIEIRASYEELIKQKLSFIPYNIKRFFLDVVSNFSLKNTNAVIANSKMYQKQLQTKDINSVVINPGLQYPPSKIPSKAKGKYFVVGFLGRLAPEKGAEILIRALAKLKEPNIKLEIAGDGPQRPYLEKLCQELHLENKVEFLGFQPNYNALSRFDILVNTTTVKAPLEMVNCEAAYMGVPVVCFGNDQYPETVMDGVTGLKINKINIDLLSQAIKRCVSNHQLLSQLSSRSRKFAEENYSFERQMLKIKELYATLDQS